MSIHRGGLRALGALAAFLVAGLAGLGAGSGAAGDGFKDMNAIIRSLGPVEYLPEHGGTRPSIDLDIGFAFDSAALLPEAERQLDALAAALASERLADNGFLIAGHTDSRGASSYNQALSERRAAAVKAYLVGRHAIDPSRLDMIGWGEEQPRYPLDPRNPKNRRVEIVSLAPSRPVAAGGDGRAEPPPPGDSKRIKIVW